MLPSERFMMEHGRPEINYGLIAKAIEFYKLRGFQYIEVPWIVPEPFVKITHPGPFPFTTDYGILVGSAEQSLLMLALEQKLQINQLYLAASPCFRDDAIDEIHQKSFFKVELFVLGTENHSDFLMNCAKTFFRSLGLQPSYETSGPQQTDLCHKSIELGSYGVRQYDQTISWSYGTGIAEPRTSYALSI